MKKLTAKQIESIVNRLNKLFEKAGVYNGNTICIYANGKRWVDVVLEDGDFNPRDYFEYCNPETISISFDGSPLYAMMNGYNYSAEEERLITNMDNLFDEYDLYLEMGDSWNASLLYNNWALNPEPDPEEKNRIYITWENMAAIPAALRVIDQIWTDNQNAQIDRGSCVIGAALEFDYEGIHYEMPPLGRYQGSLTWEDSLPEIERLLKTAGATNIRYNPGRMD